MLKLKLRPELRPGQLARIAAVLKVNAKSYKWVWGRLLFLLLAMLASVTTLSAVLVTNQAAKQSYAAASQPLVDNIHYQIINQQRQLGIAKQDYAALRRLGYTQLIPVITADIKIAPELKLRVFGVDPFAMSAQDTSLELNFELGNNAADIALIHPKLAQQHGWADTQQLRDLKGRALPQLRFAEGFGLAQELIVDIAWLSNYLGSSQLSHIWVQLDPQQSSQLESLQSDLPPHLRLRALVTGDKAAQLTDAFHLNLIAMSFMCFVVCLFIMTNAAHLLLLSRMERMRCLRQLGITRADIYAALVIEFLMFCLLCAVLGLLIGLKLAHLLAPTLDASFAALFSIRLGFSQGQHLNLILLNFVLLVLGCSLALYLPAKQLNAQLSQIKSTEFAAPKRRQTLQLIVFGIASAAACLALRLWSYSLSLSFICIGLLLFAGVSSWLILQPMALTWIKKRISAMRYPFAHVFAANSLMLSQRSKLAMCAFYLAVSANMGINLMVDSFRQATVDWVSQRLAADFYASDDAPEALTQWLEQHPQVVAVERRDHFDIPVSTAPTKTQLHAAQAAALNSTVVDAINYPNSALYQQAMKFERSLPIKDKLWQNFGQAESVFINQQMAYLHRLKLGQQIYLGPDNPQAFLVAGVYLDYGNPLAQMSLSASSIEKLGLSPSSSSQSLAIELASGSDPQAWLDQLKVQFPYAQHYSREQIIELSLNTFDQTFVITDALNVITLLVAAISLASSMIVIQRESQAQNALLRCAGISAIKMFWGQLAQYSGLVLLSSLLALPLALGLSEILITQINYHAFHWSYPLIIDSQILLRSLVFAWSCVLISCAAVLAYQIRKPLLEDLRCLT